jgi:1-aminocyclopropane-1-carboxylate deaminase/D-cysteine desulfhydrase-like pyridoxal-dependent ACC family enzyme
MKEIVVDPSLLVAKIRGRLPWCGLGSWPTPLERDDALAGASGLEVLWVKREDRSASAGGGNKVRALEFLLGGAPAGAVFVTLGATGSTHCLATAVHAAAHFGGAVLAQFPQPETEASAAVRAAAERVARRVVRGPRVALPLTVGRAWIAARAFGARRWIPAGGASPHGVLGHLIAGCELASLPTAPDAIVVPLGSGGTAAGLLLATAALEWPTRVVAARVAPPVVANAWRVRRLIQGVRRLLGRHDIRLPRAEPPLVIEALGPGYGAPSEAGETARARALSSGLRLDPTYGAKAFATLATLGQRGFQRVVFWHTFAFPELAIPSDPAVAGVR